MKLDKQQQLLHLKLLEDHFFFDIELSANCNLKCSFCPRDYIKRNKKQMPKSIAKKLNDWLPEKCNIMFAGMGEPLLYKDIFKIINSIANNKRIIGITTNGQTLNKKNIDKLFKTNLHFLQISVNALDNKIYKEISGGVSNKKIMGALKLISKRNSNNFDLQLSFVNENQIKSKVEEQKKFSEKYKAIFFSKKIHNRGGFLNSEKNDLYNDCYLFSQITYITSDGDILYCCHDLQKNNIIGNIKTHTFSEILKIKKDIINQNKWLQQCNICNDAGRKTIIEA